MGRVRIVLTVKMEEQNHPLLVFGLKKNWTREETSDHFEVSYSEFRQIVTGWGRPSWKRAKKWESLGKGFSASDVMEWHDAHSRVGAS